MQNRTQVFIHVDDTILDALIKMNRPFLQTLICVDDQKCLEGTISYKDVRTALIEGHHLQDKVAKVMNQQPIYVQEQVSKEEAAILVGKQTTLIPIVDNNQIVIDYYHYPQQDSNNSIKTKTITILGVGYVGLTLALVLAEKGFKVNGYDKNTDLLEKLKNKRAPFFETGIKYFLKKHCNENVQFTADIEEANGDIYIITVGTPLIKTEKKPNIDYIRAAATDIGQQLKKGDLVLLRSTVPVGCSRNVVLPTLEAASNLKCGRDFYLAFTPERTAEGVALKELNTNPQIIGAFDEVSYEYASRLFLSLTKSVINVGGLEEAELCKLMDNTYRDHIFAYANNLATLAEKLQINLHQLIDAVNFGYKRNHIPKPSPGVGGPCLSKDPYILASVFEQHDLDKDLLLNCRKVNESAPVLLREKLEDLLKKAGKDIKDANISLIGMAFKGNPETSDLRDSTSLWVLDQMPDKSKVSVYDPVVKDKDIKALGVKPKSLKAVFTNADAVIVLNNHKSYQDIKLSKMCALMNKPAVFIDTWNNFNSKQIKQIEGISYGGLGNV